MSSVRQGDPLAPLIFILVTDAFHEGLRRGLTWGYHFRPDEEGALRVCSSGYMDDAIALATSVQDVVAMHEWVREFFGAHCAALNCTKTELLCPSARTMEALRGRLKSVDGTVSIVPRPPGHTIRYLGVWLNIKLCWNTQITKMDRTVRLVCASMTRGAFTVPMVVFTVAQFLIPRLRAGLLVADITKKTLLAWEKLITTAARSADAITMDKLNHDGFLAVTGIPSLIDRRWMIRGESMMVSLNSSFVAARTARSRLFTSWGSRHGVSRICVTWRALEGIVGAKVSDEGPREGPIYASERGVHWKRWNPYHRPTLSSLGRVWRDGTVSVYTDGSTGASPHEPSGFSAVVTIGGSVVMTGRGPCRASGNNFLAEAVGILYALHLTPSAAPLHIGSDSVASIGATNRCRVTDWLGSVLGLRTNTYAIPQRARAISAARPVLNMIRSMVSNRIGPVTLSHVRAHSGKDDFASRMNDLADREANEARLEWAGRSGELPIWLAGEDRFRVQIGGYPVVGNYRRAIHRHLELARLQRWAGGPPPETRTRDTQEGGHDESDGRDVTHVRILPASDGPELFVSMNPLRRCGPHQVRLVRSTLGGVHSLLKYIRRSRDPFLRRFYALALMEYLPVERRLAVTSRSGGRGDVCKLCGLYRESVRHVFVCDNVIARTVRARCTSSVKAILQDSRVEMTFSDTCPGPPTVVSPGRVVWTPAWFDMTGTLWMRIWVGDGLESPLNNQERDGLGDALGVLPAGLAVALDKYWDGLGWVRRPLGTVQALMQHVRAEIIDAALQTYSARCVAMSDWWKSNCTQSQRARRWEDMASNARNRDRRSAEKELKAFQERHVRVPPPPGSVASRLRTHRRPTDPGPVITEVPLELYIAEQEHRYRGSRNPEPDLPWF